MVRVWSWWCCLFPHAVRANKDAPAPSSRSQSIRRTMVTIGTHSGSFQADEAMGVWMLRQLPEYASATLVRSRDPKVLETLTIVIDVGGTFDHTKLRYDHHQRGFFETFDGAAGVATGPENATGKYKTKLSATGLVYKHYGRELLCALHPELKASVDKLEWVYDKLYNDLIEGVDAIDNGVEISDEPRYKEGSGISSRVGRLNARWNAPEGGPTEDERFETASALCGAEVAAVLDYIVSCELPARVVVEEALLAREAVDGSGEVMVLNNGGCPWKTHLYELERTHGLTTLVKFVLYTDQSGMWRVQAVTQEGTAFTNRLGLLEAWRGVRDAELTAIAGIDGCKFVHVSGFIGGNATKEGALAMALKTISA